MPTGECPELGAALSRTTREYEAVITDLWKRYADACVEHRPDEARQAQQARDALRLVRPSPIV